MKPIALLAAVATAIGVVVLPVAASAAVVPEATVVFSADGSGVLTPGNDFTVSGTIANTSDRDFPAGTATVYLDGGVIGTRADLSSWLDSDDPVAQNRLGSVVGTIGTPAIPAGRTASVSIPVAAAAVGIATDAAWGARKLAVLVTDGTSEIGQSRSTVIWNSSSSYAPVSLAIALPLTVPTPTTGLIPAETLAAYTAANGILTRELDQAIDRHIAIGIDPMIITSIRILGTSAPASAHDWLARLAAAANEVFPLTYADSDVAAANQAGAQGVIAPTSFTIDPKLFPGYTPAPTASPTTSPVPAPTVTAAPTLPTTASIGAWTYTAGLANLVWPDDDSVAEKDLDAFAREGFATTLLSSGNVDYPDLSYTPGAHATVDHQDAMVSDADLSSLFRQAASAVDDATWQKTMADLSGSIALIAAQNAPGTRDLLMTLDRSAPDSDTRLSETMQALAGLPWAGFARLSDVLASAPVTGTSLGAKPEASDRIARVKAMLQSEAEISRFSSILTDPSVLTGERRLSLLAALANTWKSQSTAWRTVTSAYLKKSNTTLSSVQIAHTGSQALLSDTVNLGVAVTNDLDWPVNVIVTVRSPNGVIEVENNRVPLTIEANSQAKASVPVTALANGDVVVRASLFSATGVPIGVPHTLDVNVQAGWESAITGVFAGLVIAVFGFGIYRNIAKRRKKNRRNPDAAAADEGDPA